MIIHTMIELGGIVAALVAVGTVAYYLGQRYEASVSKSEFMDLMTQFRLLNERLKSLVDNGERRDENIESIQQKIAEIETELRNKISDLYDRKVDRRDCPEIDA